MLVFGNVLISNLSHYQLIILIKKITLFFYSDRAILYIALWDALGFYLNIVFYFQVKVFSYFPL